MAPTSFILISVLMNPIGNAVALGLRHEDDLANGKRRRGRPKESRNRPKAIAGATGDS